MSLPIFFDETISASPGQLDLNEETSKHIVKVLRLQEGDQVLLTNGKGLIANAFIKRTHHKVCTVEVKTSSIQPPRQKEITIAISLIKNAGRFEWFLEKAAEIGVGKIFPLICSRTEKQHLKHERMKTILVSAMIQSQQSWLCELQEPIPFDQLIAQGSHGQKFIAHCEKTNAQPLNGLPGKTGDSIILIGPEGDFTTDEINLAVEKNYIPVSLGETRLRTETAGVVAASILCVCR